LETPFQKKKGVQNERLSCKIVYIPQFLRVNSPEFLPQNFRDPLRICMPYGIINAVTEFVVSTILAVLVVATPARLFCFPGVNLLD
jgi:hypothetical protein